MFFTFVFFFLYSGLSVIDSPSQVQASVNSHNLDQPILPVQCPPANEAFVNEEKFIRDTDIL